MNANRRQCIDLDGLWQDTASSEFREALLSETLRHVQHRRSNRRLRQGIIFVFCVVLFSTMVWNTREPARRPVPISKPSLIVVRSMSLQAGQIIGTHPGGVEVIRSSRAGLAWIETSSAKRQFHEINDEQLFALLSGRPAGLVRSGPNRVELIFLDPEDRNGFEIH